MKKLFLMLLVLCVALVTFAQEAEEVMLPTAEEAAAAMADLDAVKADVAALKAKPAVTLGGGVEFSIGNVGVADGDNNPIVTGSGSATATASVTLDTPEVAASVGINLLASPSVASTVEGFDQAVVDVINQNLGGGPYVLKEGIEDIDADVVKNFEDLEAYIGYFNDNAGALIEHDPASTTVTVDSLSVWDATKGISGQAAVYNSLIDALNDGIGETYNLDLIDTTSSLASGFDDGVTNPAVADADADDGVGSDAKIDLRSYRGPLSAADIAAGKTEATETTVESFILDTTAEEAAIAGILGEVQGILNTAVATAVNNILDAADNVNVRNINPVSGSLSSDIYAYVATLIDLTTIDNGGATVTTGLTEYDEILILQAYDFAKSYEALSIVSGDGLAVNTTITAADFLTSAKLTLKKVFGVVDITADWKGGHVSVGGINVDGHGHFDESDADDAVDAYPSYTVALSDGVVENLKASVSLYTDNVNAEVKAAKDAVVEDDIYTWLQEPAAAEAAGASKLGLGVMAGYKMAISETMSVGGDVTVGMYDLGGDNAFGIAIAPMFSMGDLSVNGSFATGYDITAINAKASYANLAGLVTPTIRFDYVKGPLAYDKNEKYSSGLAAVKNEGGINLGVDLAVALTDMIGLPLSVGGSFDYATASVWDGTTADGVLDATTGVTSTASKNQVAGVLAWSGNLSVEPITGLVIKGKLGDLGIWSGTKGSVFNWNANIAYKINDTISANIGYGNSNKADKDGGQVATSDFIVGVDIVHGAATISAKLGDAFNADSGSNDFSYSIATSVSF